ncbi:MAG: phosphate ABC transporter, permease protein PstA [Acidimicrobiales bacterium mtb01]|nr:MAG: phosphate ABC transporter, permease protein PstA [Acidimicrobiales bacterium mtb01]
MTAATNQTTVVQPLRPWRPTFSQQFARFVTVVLVVAAAAVVVLVSPLAGLAGIALVAIPLQMAVSVARSSRHGSVAARNDVATSLIWSAFLVLLVPWMSIIFTVVRRGYQAISVNFFTDDMRITAPDADLASGGIAHAIVGTLIMVAIASIVSVPLGILSGIYITEIRGRFTKVVRFIVQAMSGVPSIVAGLFIYSTLVLYNKSYSGLAGALALAVLMVPTVARTSEEVLKLVPEDLRFAGYALGSSQASNVFRIVLPTVRSGLVTSGILGVARVAGETAPLLMTAQVFLATKGNPLDGPLGSLPVVIFSFFQNGADNAVTRAWGASMVLMILITFLFALARAVSADRRRSRR